MDLKNISKHTNLLKHNMLANRKMGYGEGRLLNKDVEQSDTSALQ